MRGCRHVPRLLKAGFPSQRENLCRVRKLIKAFPLARAPSAARSIPERTSRPRRGLSLAPAGHRFSCSLQPPCLNLLRCNKAEPATLNDGAK
jgi:hypothetical protein